MGDAIFDDDRDDFMKALGLEQPREPEPVTETKVEPRPIVDADFIVYEPLAEGPVASTLDLQLRFTRRLLRGAPFSLSDPAFKETSSKKLHGVYALYYQGPYPLYAPLVSLASRNPLRAGKSFKTTHRILGHRESIRKSDLSVDDFTVRFLILPPVWRSFVEDTIFILFLPIWDVALRGLGTTGTGSSDINNKRAGQRRSDYDSLHNVGRRSGASTTAPVKWLMQLQVERAIPDSLRAYHKTMKLLAEVPTPAVPIVRPEPFVSLNGASL